MEKLIDAIFLTVCCACAVVVGVLAGYAIGVLLLVLL